MQQQFSQKPGIDFILKKSFAYWSRTLGFQIMFSIIYFSIFLTVYFYLSTRFDAYDQLSYVFAEYFRGEINAQSLLGKMQAIQQTPDFEYSSYGILGASVFLYPLNLGFFQIYRKTDLKEPVGISDLFAGYNGLNFFRYSSYFIGWYLIFDILKAGIILPFFWIILTVFTAPLMFFQNKTVVESLVINWKVVRKYFIEVAVCSMVAIIFKYLGFAIFFLGCLFTFPFWNAVIYSLYSAIFDEKKEV